MLSAVASTERYEPIESVQTGFRMEGASSRMEGARLNLNQTQITEKNIQFQSQNSKFPFSEEKKTKAFYLFDIYVLRLRLATAESTD